MLNEQELVHLEEHAVAMLQQVILPTITPDGCILVRDGEGQVLADPVATHHAVELCLELNKNLTDHIVEAACSWMLKSGGGVQDPFLLTTLAAAGRVSPEEAHKIVHEVIVPRQLPSGFIDLHAGFLDGGSAFSTLWAIRIIALLCKDDLSKVAINRAFKAIDEHWTDLHRTSFKGFYCELKWLVGERCEPGSRSAAVLNEILDAQSDDGTWDGNLLYTSYILGNLASLPGTFPSRVTESISRGLQTLFDLSKPAEHVPVHIQKAAENYAEPTYLQLCIRAVLSAARYLRRLHGKEVSVPLSASIFGSYPRLYRTVASLEYRLKVMDTQYGEIQKNFAHLERSASTILSESPYEKNVFVMMPFRQKGDERYEKIEVILRRELKRLGLRAWLASDLDAAPQLWDNVASYMLACKYGVAVFTRHEKERTSEEEFNPNVSLELGFFLSRAKRVLILKDRALNRLQTDLVGHLYEEFDLNQVGRQLPAIVKKWIRQITKSSDEKNLKGELTPANGHQ